MCVRGFVPKGILCFCTRLALEDVAASFLTVPDSSSQPVETRVGAVQCSCAASKEPQMPFHVLGIVTPKAPWEIHHRHLVFEGFWEQVRQMCHRWPFGDGMGLDDLSIFFFHPVFCSSVIYLLRNRWCQFQILNSLGWMSLLDEMLFLNPAPYLPAFFCEHGVLPAWQAKHRDQREQLVKIALVWVQLL